MSTEQRGTVATFDEAVGWGTVRSGQREYGFHCTAIADGTRTIAVGTPVTFTVTPGLQGRWEATGLRPV